jgi:hypothetical protein
MTNEKDKTIIAYGMLSLKNLVDAGGGRCASADVNIEQT